MRGKKDRRRERERGGEEKVSSVLTCRFGLFCLVHVVPSKASSGNAVN